MDCKDCKTRHRADKLIEDFTGESADGWTNEQMQQFIADNNIACPECGGHNFTDIRQFNLMFKTFQGVTEDAKSQLYLRPETAQGIFVNFPSIQRTTRKKVPFGVCQVGKSFRNEITPGNFIFAFASLSRWSANSSVSRVRTSTGSTTGRISAKLAFEPRSGRSEHPPARPQPEGALPSTPRRRRILSICSRSAGASFGALRRPHGL